MRLEHKFDMCPTCGKCRSCNECACPPEKTQEEKLRDDLAALREVQAGWAFGVPEDGRDQWLDAVASVMKKYS